ncbi:MAG: GntR family transcriptional regulator [Lachnospiraceae bacterium]|uniref:GntR family transcriptional regulator n=1 Tax=Falcatimonas sp. MSJ-15 TaxID=2841515 RepID=UPI001C113913|nr:GntR family transcriptional regulator [Lachnospiraceae bacterium]MBU5470847.1 GntR family transcriptional regulator [Falcatimonas sp. MSJ-15]MEE0960686.1 GntR family transcriptional regulator [Lachnospiraceae bacterium]
MNILLSNSSDKPIYEQIISQVIAQIISGELSPGDSLPSMRALAKDLRISVITTKRAYEELERLGYIITSVGRGSFVAETNTELLHEEKLKIIEEYIGKAVEEAKIIGLSEEDIIEMVKLNYENID